MKQILIIDDDMHIGNMIEELLTKEQYNVLRAYSGTEALLVLSAAKPDLILLDLMLPGLSGEALLPQIKNIPVIVLSAKVDITDKVNLLLNGAVDYMTKPFDPKELLARIVVQLRNAKIQETEQILSFKNLQLDITSHLAYIGSHSLHLTKTEYAILKLLMQNPTQVITKSQILERISEDTPDCMEGSLKVHISNLRKKFREHSKTEYIESVWGIGFKMCES